MVVQGHHLETCQSTCARSPDERREQRGFRRLTTLQGAKDWTCKESFHQKATTCLLPPHPQHFRALCDCILEWVGKKNWNYSKYLLYLPTLMPRKNISAELSLFQTQTSFQPGNPMGSLAAAQASHCAEHLGSPAPGALWWRNHQTGLNVWPLAPAEGNTSSWSCCPTLPAGTAHIQLKVWEQLLLSEQQREPGPQPRSPGQEPPMLLPRPCSTVMVTWESRKKTRGQNRVFAGEQRSNDRG